MIVLAVVIGAAVDVFTYGLRIFVTGGVRLFREKAPAQNSERERSICRGRACGVR
jgi:hypothetical protein